MLKKFFILIILLSCAISPALAVHESSIIAAAVLFLHNGDMTVKKWINAFNTTAAFVYYDIKLKKETEMFRHTGIPFSAMHQMYRYFDYAMNYLYYEGQIEQYNTDYDTPIAIYKISNNTIYQYDYKTEPKKGILGYFGFREEGPGNLVATAKITDDGTMTKFDINGNKILTFKFSNPSNINLYNSKDKKIGEYHLLTREELDPRLPRFFRISSDITDSKTNSAAKTSNNDFSGAIVPVTIILANAGELQDSEWTQKLKNIDYINCYGSQNQLTGEFSTFGNDFYQYDKHYALVARYSDFGNDVYHYDANNTLIGHFSSFGDDIYQYDQNNAFIGRFTFFGNELYHYDKDDRKIGSYSIFGSSILQYDKYGKNIAEYSFF